MKTRELSVSLTTTLHRFVQDQVRSGRYEDEAEVVRDALRLLQQREIDQFDRLFGDYPNAPQGEPTREDEQAIQAAVARCRGKRRAA
jgi:putative addiction module CopG family antidote